MREIVTAMFSTASTAESAMQDVKVARIPSAVVRLLDDDAKRHEGQRALDWSRRANAWQRPLVAVVVDDIHALAVIGILRQYGPVHIEQRTT